MGLPSKKYQLIRALTNLKQKHSRSPHSNLPQHKKTSPRSQNESRFSASRSPSMPRAFPWPRSFGVPNARDPTPPTPRELITPPRKRTHPNFTAAQSPVKL